MSKLIFLVIVAVLFSFIFIGLDFTALFDKAVASLTIIRDYVGGLLSLFGKVFTLIYQHPFLSTIIFFHLALAVVSFLISIFGKWGSK